MNEATTRGRAEVAELRMALSGLSLTALRKIKTTVDSPKPILVGKWLYRMPTDDGWETCGCLMLDGFADEFWDTYRSNSAVSARVFRMLQIKYRMEAQPEHKLGAVVTAFDSFGMLRGNCECRGNNNARTLTPSARATVKTIIDTLIEQKEVKNGNR